MLLLVYVKAKFDNIPAATLMKLKEALDAADEFDRTYLRECCAT